MIATILAIYFPELYLARRFHEKRDEAVTCHNNLLKNTPNWSRALRYSLRSASAYPSLSGTKAQAATGSAS